ncbi:hypothetical protein LOY97_006547 [Ophidiomyces ophidiicola]|nr:hypothetical protein LOZ49_006695 [Ophidiomyces ophidiicola]KAI2126925.1 hypothetical protein LOZ29_006809 [Ophidiomyces ophidiicola]KAI2128516.1 hypothetical protein LOZ28_006809 [Ophidiomyces ophidiicola]KAI2207824.1 hypothetical protein LOZ15_006720 [Ophidiomyces ophidiicola]KAI2451554.1 hypothetical protein LOY97_006547 [Ophidiomyces ophidiicola]
MFWKPALAVFTTATLALYSTSRLAKLNHPGLNTPALSLQTHPGDTAPAQSRLAVSHAAPADEPLLDDAIPYGDQGPVFKLKLLRSERFRRLVGDFETCAADLLGFENALAGSTGAKGAGVRACQEAVFTFLRWAKKEYQFVDLSQSSPDLLGNDHGSASPSKVLVDERARRSQNSRRTIDPIPHPTTPRRRSTLFTKRELPCEEEVCRIGDLSVICNKPKVRMTTAETDVCKLCYPRNEKQLKAYCVLRERREQRAFYVAFGMLVIITLSAAGTIVFNDCVRKRRLDLSQPTTHDAHASKLFPWCFRPKPAWRRKPPQTQPPAATAPVPPEKFAEAFRPGRWRYGSLGSVKSESNNNNNNNNGSGVVVPNGAPRPPPVAVTARPRIRTPQLLPAISPYQSREDFFAHAAYPPPPPTDRFVEQPRFVPYVATRGV